MVPELGPFLFFCCAGTEKRRISLKGKVHNTPVSDSEHEISELLAPYVNGNVTLEETRRIQDHLPGCQQCQKELGIIMMIKACGLRKGRGKITVRSKMELVP
jgi:hypothetical protein